MFAFTCGSDLHWQTSPQFGRCGKIVTFFLLGEIRPGFSPAVTLAVAVIVIAAAARLVGGASRQWRWFRAGQAGFVPRGGFRNQPAVRAEVKGAAIGVLVLAPTGRELAGWAGGAPRPGQSVLSGAVTNHISPQ